MREIWGFEDSDHLLEEFRVAVSFLGLYFVKMRVLEVIDHSHHRLPLRNAFDGKIVLVLMNPDLDGDWPCALEFRYSARNSYASRPTSVS